MTLKDKKKLIEALKQLIGGKIPNEYCGICSNVRHITNIYCSEYNKYFLTWKHFSGDDLYPVPSPNKKYYPSICYSKRIDMWTGKYGELRKDLCKHIIKQLSKEMKL